MPILCALERGDCQGQLIVLRTTEVRQLLSGVVAEGEVAVGLPAGSNSFQRALVIGSGGEQQLVLGNASLAKAKLRLIETRVILK